MNKFTEGLITEWFKKSLKCRVVTNKMTIYFYFYKINGVPKKEDISKRFKRFKRNLLVKFYEQDHHRISELPQGIDQGYYLILVLVYFIMELRLVRNLVVDSSFMDNELICLRVNWRWIINQLVSHLPLSQKSQILIAVSCPRVDAIIKC